MPSTDGSLTGSILIVQPPSECLQSSTSDGFVAISATSSSHTDMLTRGSTSSLAWGFLLVVTIAIKCIVTELGVWNTEMDVTARWIAALLNPPLPQIGA